jgi:hypothetical protein
VLQLGQTLVCQPLLFFQRPQGVINAEKGYF